MNARSSSLRAFQRLLYLRKVIQSLAMFLKKHLYPVQAFDHGRGACRFHATM